MASLSDAITEKQIFGCEQIVGTRTCFDQTKKEALIMELIFMVIGSMSAGHENRTEHVQQDDSLPTVVKVW
jgi:hypothetical protein